MSRLVQGKWPLLKLLDVSCKGFDTAGVQTKMWTQSFLLLECLDLPVAALDLHGLQKDDGDLDFYQEPSSLDLCLIGSSVSVSQHHSNLRQFFVSSTTASETELVFVHGC